MNCAFRLTCTKYVQEINDQSTHRVVTHHRVDRDSIPVVLFYRVTSHREPAAGMDVQIISLAAGCPCIFLEFGQCALDVCVLSDVNASHFVTVDCCYSPGWISGLGYSPRSTVLYTPSYEKGLLLQCTLPVQIGVVPLTGQVSQHEPSLGVGQLQPGAMVGSTCA